MTGCRGWVHWVSAASTLLAGLLLLPQASAAGRPNIVLLLADDVGFSDLGAYGSEISTPNIDALANAGTLFANFRASPSCAPTRAMLLTGVSAHRAGVGSIPETLPPEHRGHPSYLGRLRDDVVTVASMLRDAGYRTYVTGKWHLGHEPGALPHARGFDRSFVLDASGADNFAQKSYLPYYDHAPWFEDDRPAVLPDDFYSSEFLVDRMIDYIDGDVPVRSEEPMESRAARNPFFAYIGFQAVHIPVQAPREFVERYAGVYDMGWDRLREARFENVLARGLLPAETKMGPMPPGLDAWDDVDPERRPFLAKSMAVNAGMLEAMDFHVGRLIAHLQDIGEYERTIFLVLSDNGAEPNRPTDHPIFERWLRTVGYNRDYATLGEAGSYVFIGPEFASAASAPGAFFKFHAGEGGLRVPLIIKGGGVRTGISHGFSYVTDLVPTMLELAGVLPPASVDGVPVQAFSGRSLVPILDGSSARVYTDDDVVALETSGNAAVFRGDFKLVRNMPPFGDGAWHLHDLTRDPGETVDLSAVHPDVRAELLAEYELFVEREGVLDMPANYTQMGQMARATRQRMIRRNWHWLVGVPLALMVLGGLGVRTVRRARIPV